MSHRWERLLDRKPIPLLEHLLDEMARHLGQQMQRWPLPVEEVDVATGAGFAELLSGERPRPADEVFRQALRLARWDLERKTDVVDDYFRNRRYLESGLAEAERPALLLVSRWLVEQLLSLKEASQGRVSRSQLTAVLERLGPSARG